MRGTIFDGSAEVAPIGLFLLPPYGWIFAVVFGALWGSFFNVAIHRLAREDARLRDVVSPPSHCPRCNTPIRAFDNVPILGWLLLGGRCRSCREPISIRYPLVEAAGALLGAAVYMVFVLGQPDTLAHMYGRFFASFFFAGTLFVLAMIDLDTMLLPEAITIPAIPTFFLVGRFLDDVPLWDAVIGAAVGFASLKAVEIGYRLVTGRDGLGGGDSMLMAIVGGYLGWRALPFTLGLGAWMGTLVAVPLLIARRRRERRDAAKQQDDVAVQQEGVAAQQDDVAAQQEEGEAVSLRHAEVPFGPFLVAGAFAYMFLQDRLWEWLFRVHERVAEWLLVLVGWIAATYARLHG